MVTNSCRCPRGSSELGEQRGEIAACEGPLERLRRVDIVFLEAKKPLADGAERSEVIRREDFALDDGEIDLDLIEPAGVDGVWMSTSFGHRVCSRVTGAAFLQWNSKSGIVPFKTSVPNGEHEVKLFDH
jgi:hypothetical protein